MYNFSATCEEVHWKASSGQTVAILFLLGTGNETQGKPERVNGQGEPQREGTWTRAARAVASRLEVAEVRQRPAAGIASGQRF